MKFCTLLVSVALVVCVGTLAQPMFGTQSASARALVALATDEGTIRSVDLESRSFVLAIATDDSVRALTVKVSDKTTFTLDGKESSMEKAVIPGYRAKVTHVDGSASSVEVTSPREPR